MKSNKRPTRDAQSLLDAELIGAVRACDLAVVGDALRRGANPCAREKNMSALAMASRTSLACVELLLDSGSDIRKKSEDGAAAAIEAAKTGQVGVLRRLRRAGYKMDQVCGDGRSALMWAACGGHADCVEALLGMSVKVGRLDNRLRSALYLACAAHNEKPKDHIACARLLLRAGARVDEGEESGVKPLMAAAYTGQAELVRFLVEAGADIEAGDKRGMRALMYAAENGAVNSLRALLDLGANAQARCSEGKTAEERGFNKYHTVGGLFLAAERERLALESDGASQDFGRKDARGKRL